MDFVAINYMYCLKMNENKNNFYQIKYLSDWRRNTYFWLVEKFIWFFHHPKNLIMTLSVSMRRLKFEIILKTFSTVREHFTVFRSLDQPKKILYSFPKSFLFSRNLIPGFQRTTYLVIIQKSLYHLETTKEYWNIYKYYK